MKNQIRIAFTGGGTGGHIYPLLAVAEEVRKKLSQNPETDFKLYYFGNAGQYGLNFVKLNIKIIPIISFKIRRYMSPLNILDALKIPFAFLQSLVRLLFIMPDAVFSKGGTGSIAVVMAAWFYHIPVFIHESDSVPGLSTKFSMPFARRVAVSFEKTLELISGEKVALTGNPVRADLLEPAEDLTPEKSKKILAFDPSIPLVLVMGGSQGAVKINEFMIDNVKSFVTKYQVLHQVGQQNFAQFKSELAIATEHFLPEERNRYKIIDFIKSELKEAYIAADIVISRAGSGAIFELAAFKKPSILIPLDSAAGNHQKFNAYEYAKNGACVVIEESNLKPALFFGQIEMILGNKGKYQTMSQAAGDFAKPKSAEIIAQELINLALK